MGSPERGIMLCHAATKSDARKLPAVLPSALANVIDCLTITQHVAAAASAAASTAVRMS